MHLQFEFINRCSTYQSVCWSSMTSSVLHFVLSCCFPVVNELKNPRSRLGGTAAAAKALSRVSSVPIFWKYPLGTFPREFGSEKRRRRKFMVADDENKHTHTEARREKKMKKNVAMFRCSLETDIRWANPIIIQAKPWRGFIPSEC